MSSDRRLQTMLRRAAEANYSPESATYYREADEAGRESTSHAGKCRIIRSLSQSFDHPITVLDLGCGTGRYFHCVENVERIVGVDPSANMLKEARTPVLGGNRNISVVRSTLHEVAFLPASFDVIVCVGVLGEWCAIDVEVMRHISPMVKPHGIFFFSVVEYQPIQVTLKRRLASVARPFLAGGLRRWVEFRLRDFTISEKQVRKLGHEFFQDVEVAKWQSPTSRIDLHCVLRRPTCAA